MKVHITAKEDCIFYIAGAVDEGYGKPFSVNVTLTMPIGEIHRSMAPASARERYL